MAATECIVQRTAGYTVMSNYHLRDKHLSLKAKGLLSVILSLPEDWDYTIAGMAMICDTGKDSIRASVVELEKAGYINRKRLKAEGGKFAGNQYTIREVPATVEQPLSAFPTMDKPTMEKPTSEKPSLEKPTEIIKDQSITDEIKAPPAAPAEPVPEKGKGKGKRRKKTEPEDQLDDGQMRNLLIAETAAFGTAFGVDNAVKNRLFQLATKWYQPRTLKGEYATPPLHTELGVKNLFRKISRGAAVIGAVPALDVFEDALCEGYTTIYDDRFKKGYKPPQQFPPPDSGGAYRCL